MLFSNLLHNFHCKFVVVGCDICSCKNRSQLVLRRSNLVVLCLSKNTEFPKLIIKVCHESGNSCLDCAEVMVVKFLSFRSFCTKECSACVDKVFSLVINIFIYKEVFLLRTYCCCNSRNICFAEKIKNFASLCADSLH